MTFLSCAVTNKCRILIGGTTQLRSGAFVGAVEINKNSPSDSSRLWQVEDELAPRTQARLSWLIKILEILKIIQKLNYFTTNTIKLNSGIKIL